MRTKFYWPSLFMAIVILGCNQNKIYNNYVEINEFIWHQDSLVNFAFEVPLDTITYDLSYNIRYAATGYSYYNLYVSYYLEDSTGNIISSDLQEIILFDKKTGEPLGDGLSDIFDREVPIFEGMKFPYIGKYQFKVKQFMRTKKLPGIMSFGLKIEKNK